jgi:hypothetical protein
MLGGVEQALGRHARAVAFARHAAWLDPEASRSQATRRGDRGRSLTARGGVG